MNADTKLQEIWYGKSPLGALLAPLGWIYRAVVAIRRAAYEIKLLRPTRLSRAVVVIGNLTVGGTGKTPLIMWLTKALKQRGVRVGIITRGYGGKSPMWPLDVAPNSSAHLVGDESVLIARRTGAIVVAGPDRVANARQAIERGAEIVLSDDGLQHYKLARDYEIAVVDGERGFGNRRMLPAGPLREPVSRLKSVNVVVVNRRDQSHTVHQHLDRQKYTLVESQLGVVQSLKTNEQRELWEFKGQRVHAIAGIGNPDSFFAALRALDLEVDAHALPDHASITAQDLFFGDDAPVLMTEKDAVKCRGIADARCWSVAVELHIADADLLLDEIEPLARKSRDSAQ